MPSTLLGCSLGRPEAAIQITGQTVGAEMFNTVKSSACLRGSARKKHLHKQYSDGRTPKTKPPRKRLSYTSSEIPSIATKWYT